MATYVNVTVGGGELLNRDRLQREATRFDALEKQKDKELQAEKDKQGEERQGKGLKPLPYKREPAAHRSPSGGGWGTWYHESLNDIASGSGVMAIAGGPSSSDIGGRRILDQRCIYVTSGDGTARAEIPLKFELPAPPADSRTPAGSFEGRPLVTRPVGFAASYPLDINHWVLPAGNGNYMVVLMVAYAPVAVDSVGTYFADPPYPISNPDRLTIKVDAPYAAPTVHKAEGKEDHIFICSHSKVRKVAVPAGLQGLLNYFNPPPIEVDASISTSVTGGVSTTYKRPSLAGQKSYAIDPANQTFHTEFGTSWDPSIFWSLNNKYQFIDPAKVVSPGVWRLANQPAVSRNDVGGFKQMNDNSWDLQGYYEATSPLPLTFGRWTGAGNPLVNDHAKIRPINGKAGQLQLSPSRRGVVPPAPYPGLYYMDLDAVWDWGDPTYCQSMLLAMGFNAGDLKP